MSNFLKKLEEENKNKCIKNVDLIAIRIELRNERRR